MKNIRPNIRVGVALDAVIERAGLLLCQLCHLAHARNGQQCFFHALRFTQDPCCHAVRCMDFSCEMLRRIVRDHAPAMDHDHTIADRLDLGKNM